MGHSVVLRKLPADSAEDVFDGRGRCDVSRGSGLGGFENLEALVSGICRYCEGGEHNLCTIVPGPDGCCCGTAANEASARKDPIGFVATVGSGWACAACENLAHRDCATIPISGNCCCFGAHPEAVDEVIEPEKVLEGEEGQENRRRVIQARPATRKLERGFRKSGIKFFRVTCDGCRKPALVAKSSMAILASAKNSGEEIDVICDRCIENYPGQSEEPYTEEQKAEGVHVARVLDVNQRRN